MRFLTIKQIEEIRDCVRCPQFGDERYGAWGILRLDQREKIKMLCDELLRFKKEEHFEETAILVEKKFGNTHLKGFKYLVYILENYRYPVKSFMLMYKEVADKCGATPMNVERCLRTYIESSYNKKIKVSKFISKQLIEFGRVGRSSRIVLEDIADDEV
jgi:hypothetical protein